MIGDAIAAFWSWWPTARGRIEATIGGGGFSNALVGEIVAQVNAIDPSVDWELSPGAKSQHAFCLSAKGDPVLRRTTEHEGRGAAVTWKAASGSSSWRHWSD